MVDRPLVPVVEFVDLMPLHIAGIDRLGAGIVDDGHLEEEHVVRGWGSFGQFVVHAVEVVAISQKLATEPTKNQDVLAVLLYGAAALPLGEHLVVYFDLGPLGLI